MNRFSPYFWSALFAIALGAVGALVLADSLGVLTR